MCLPLTSSSITTSRIHNPQSGTIELIIIIHLHSLLNFIFSFKSNKSLIKKKVNNCLKTKKFVLLCFYLSYDNNVNPLAARAF